MDNYNVFDEFVANLLRGQKLHTNQFYNEDGFIRAVFVSKKALPNISKMKSMIQECIHNYELDNDCTLEDVDISAKRIRLLNTSVFCLHLEASAIHSENHRVYWLEVDIADHTEAYLAVDMPYVVDVKCYYED